MLEDATPGCNKDVVKDVTSDVFAQRRLQMHTKQHFRPLQERASEMATEKEAVPRSDLNSQDTKGRELWHPVG